MVLEFSRFAPLCVLVELLEARDSAYPDLTFNAEIALKAGRNNARLLTASLRSVF